MVRGRRWCGRRLSTALLTGTVVDDVLVSGEAHVLRFATTQTYVLVEAAWSYLAGQTAPMRRSS